MSKGGLEKPQPPQHPHWCDPGRCGWDATDSRFADHRSLAIVVEPESAGDITVTVWLEQWIYTPVDDRATVIALKIERWDFESIETYKVPLSMAPEIATALVRIVNAATPPAGPAGPGEAGNAGPGWGALPGQQP